MNEAGRRFECSEYFIPELLLAARAMKGALELIRPILVASLRDKFEGWLPAYMSGELPPAA